MPGNADVTFSGVRGASRNPETSEAGAFGKERSELMHAGGSTPETGRQELVYGTSQNLFEEVKQIKEIAFETKKAVADHFESHLPQEAGKTGQVMDIEQMSETVMRMIDRRMKIEAERRGIF